MVTTSVTDDNIKRQCEDEALLKLPRSGLVQRLKTPYQGTTSVVPTITAENQGL
jgi:hypothetical protein